MHKRVADPMTLESSRKRPQIGGEDDDSDFEEVLQAFDQEPFDNTTIINQRSYMDGSVCKTQTLRSLDFCQGHWNADFAELPKHDAFTETVLLVYADNVQDKCLALRGEPHNGKGSAVIRTLMFPFKRKDGGRRMFVSGISTGYSPCAGGFKSLTHEVKTIIDLDIQFIVYILNKFPVIDTVIFPGDTEDRTLFGSGIFAVGVEVTRYISEQLRSRIFQPSYKTIPVTPSVWKETALQYVQYEYSARIMSLMMQCCNTIYDTRGLPLSMYLWREHALAAIKNIKNK